MKNEIDSDPGRAKTRPETAIVSKRRATVAAGGILILFAAGLVGYFAFSADYGDGLEVTMEEADVEEEEQAHSAPLDYGDDYLSALLMGVLGFAVCLGFVRITGRSFSSKGSRNNNDNSRKFNDTGSCK